MKNTIYKSWLIAMTIILLLCVIGFFATAFIKYEMNPFNWGEDIRIIYIVICLSLLVLSLPMAGMIDTI